MNGGLSCLSSCSSDAPSDTAIAIVPDDGGAPIYGVLASEVEVEKGDFVTGIYVPDLGVVRVMTIGN